MNSQEVNVKDSHLEKRNDKIYSVTESERYVKLTFSRELDIPNYNEIKRLEDEYNAITSPDDPKLFPIAWWLWLGGVIVPIIFKLIYISIIVVVGWGAYFVLYYLKNKKSNKIIYENNKKHKLIY